MLCAIFTSVASTQYFPWFTEEIVTCAFIVTSAFTTFHLTGKKQIQWCSIVRFKDINLWEISAKTIGTVQIF